MMSRNLNCEAASLWIRRSGGSPAWTVAVSFCTTSPAPAKASMYEWSRAQPCCPANSLILFSTMVLWSGWKSRAWTIVNLPLMLILGTAAGAVCAGVVGFAAAGAVVAPAAGAVVGAAGLGASVGLAAGAGADVGAGCAGC